MTDSPSNAPRRVVTGLDGDGRSTILFDSPVPVDANGRRQLIWRAPSLPADNAGDADASVPFTMDLMRGGGANFSIVEIPPGFPIPMHATDTVDWLVILSGRIVLVMETGETILGPGDALVQRGTVHAWRNDGPDVVRMVSVTLPAHPLDPGTRA